MGFPRLRPRRLRMNNILRKMVRQNQVLIEDLVYPLFVIEGEGIKREVSSMPEVYNFSIDELLLEIDEVKKLGILAVILFGVIDADKKDPIGSQAYDDDGIIQRALRAIKGKYSDLLVIADVCLCEFTDHGHCGIIKGSDVDNDATLELLAKTAVSYAKSGADIIAPSDMMDGRVKAIRDELDKNGFSHIPIMSYSAKYASAYYGPFREAAASAPKFGDRKTYQMDPANGDEAVKEVMLDIEEGADIVMIKPALAYMDIIHRIRERVVCPVAVYNVSGEYAMVKAAAKNGWVDEKKVVLEMLTGFKRAGADIIITYHAKDAACWIKEEGGF